MKLQRTFIAIASVFCVLGLAASQATAGTGNPGCTDASGNLMQIEVNALRAGGKTIVTSPNDTTKVTSKARILKGTAETGTTLVTTLTIEAYDGETLIDSDSQANITLGVGKGGKGASLNMLTEQCVSGFITFTAEFRGVDGDGESCIGTRELRKACK